MKWYDSTVANLEKDWIYTHKELMEMLQKDYPHVSKNSYHWAITEMVTDGKITKTGYNQYQVLTATNSPRKVYAPQYTEEALSLVDLLKTQFPTVKIVLFETVLLNEFLPADKQITDNTIFIEIEKGYTDQVYQYLQDHSVPRMFYKPTPKKFMVAKSKNSIVANDLFTRSPTVRKNPYEICLEKLLVDIYCDKLIKIAYSFDDYATIASTAQNMYFVDKSTMIRYAKRKNKRAELLHDCPGLAEEEYQRQELKEKILFDAIILVETLPDYRQELIQILSAESISQKEYADMLGVKKQAITGRINSLANTIMKELIKKYKYDEARIKRIIGYTSDTDFIKMLGR